VLRFSLADQVATLLWLATLDGLRQHLTDTEVVDLIAVTGYYMMICRVLETTGIELDSDPIDWNTIAEPR
jgi:alkylhydroperoxidase family enzyme